MAFNNTRMIAYALLSALEEDLREIIKNHLDDTPIEENTYFNEDLVKRSKQRLLKDIGIIDNLTNADLVDYFDLGDTYQVINSNSEKFPLHITQLFRKSTKSFETIISIRNRVMHIRPLDFDDLTILSEFCKNLVSKEETLFSYILKTFKKMKEDPSFVLNLEIKSYDDIHQNHNLPLPDFDETGLIGRKKVIEQVKQLCLGEQYPIISILGEGGIGKTALALKVAYELLEDENCPFDAIVWVSSKTSQITVNEIRTIQGAINNSLGVIEEISDQLGSNTASLDDIYEDLENFKIILFIDNLETVLDAKIRNFIESVPVGSKIVITSRIGLGAYEFPIKLQGIEENYASQLLRQLANFRGVNTISKLDEKLLRGYVKRMHYNPSYIKWFISSVQANINIETILQKKSNLFLEFCLSNVYDYLSENAKRITDVLLSAQGFKDMPEMAYLSNLEPIDLQQAIHELMRTNMLSESTKKYTSSVKNTYQLSELARSYLQKNHKPNKTFQQNIRKKLNQLNSLYEEQRQRENRNKYHASNIKLRDKSDRIVVKKLYDSIKSIRDKDYENAFNILEEAQSLAPDYHEVARVRAYYFQVIGDLSEAREQYELSIQLSPTTSHSQLYFWFGKFISELEDDMEEAINYFKKAHNLDKDSIDVGLSLSRAYMILRDFKEAKKVLEDFSKVNSNDRNTYTKYYDTKIQILYREADESIKQNKLEDALKLLLILKFTFIEQIPPEVKDKKMRNHVKKCRFLLKKLAPLSDSNSKTKIKELEAWIYADGDD